METLTIDRGEWLTGKAMKIVDSSSLRDKTSGLMCCLGIYAHKKLGCSLQAVTGKATISSLPALTCPDWLNEHIVAERGVGHEDSPEGALIDTNDSEELSPIRRETRIAKLFKKYGNIQVKFIGRYAEATAKAKKAYAADAR